MLGTQVCFQVPYGATFPLDVAEVASLLEPIVRVRLFVLSNNLKSVVLDSKVLFILSNVVERSFCGAQKTLQRLLFSILAIARVSLLPGQRLIGMVQVHRKKVIQAFMFAANVKNIGLKVVDGSVGALDTEALVVHHDPASAKFCQSSIVMLVS